MPSSQDSSFDLPVVDISQIPQDLDGTQLHHVQKHPQVATVRKACKEWGFFRLINHGISLDLIQNIESVSRQLSSMPTDVIDRSHSIVAFRSSDSIKEICEKMWPEGNANACETIQTYNSCLSDLSQKIAKILLVSLGLDANKFYESVFRYCKSILHINHYTSVGKAEGDVALGAHTDSMTFTILYQDEAGGLEIRSKQGNWMSVKPLPHSLIINIGDCFKAWSNGWYRSAEHRVVCKGWTDRISIGYFVNFSEEMEIWAPAELVDEENPRRYKPFTFSQLKREREKDIAEKKKDFTLLVDRFAGI